MKSVMLLAAGLVAQTQSETQPAPERDTDRAGAAADQERLHEEPTDKAPAAREREAPREVLPAWVDVRNEMGKNYRLIEVELLLDGAEIARRQAPDGKELDRQFRAFTGRLTPGEHQLVARYVFQGRNRAVFSYLDGYKYRVQADYTFNVPAGPEPAGVSVVARERRGMNVPFEKRPQLTFEPSAQSAIPKPVPEIYPSAKP